MCNNIRANCLRKPEKEVPKDKITDWIEDRPVLYSNEEAKKSRKIDKDNIIYESGHPLKLHDGTRIHNIKTKELDDQYKEVCIEFVFANETKSNTVHIKRYLTDALDALERFLENSQSIFQTRNIDLSYN